jgi:DNA-binding cell septation regulator SpoVG
MRLVLTGVHFIENPEKSLLGAAKCSLLDDEGNSTLHFFVRIVNGKNGVFGSLPQQWNKTKNDGQGGFDQVIFLSERLKEDLNAAVKEAYNSKGSTSSSAPPPASIAAAPIAKEISNPVPSSERTLDDFEDEDIPF